MKKKILIFSLGYYPMPVGGAEVAIKEITDRVSPDKYEFHLIANRYNSQAPKEEKIGNVQVHRIGFTRRDVTTSDLFHPLFYFVKVLYVPLAAIKAWQLHRTHSFTAFWCMMLYMSYPVALLRLFGSKVPYALTLQEGDTFTHVFNRWYIKLFEPILLLGIRKATVVQTISTFLGTWATQKGFIGEPVLIPNAVNTGHFAQEYSEAELVAARTELGKKPGDVFLVTTSRLVTKNAADDVIRAIAQLPENVHFIVYGTGPDETMLRALTKELQIEHRIHFQGHIEHADMPKYLKACDIFIRPSRSEGMGNSFVEAMAAELPVIATQEGGIADFLFDETKNPDKETTGWAVDVDSPDQIAAAVRDITDRPDKVERVTATAKRMVLENYDWDKIAKRMEVEVFGRVAM